MFRYLKLIAGILGLLLAAGLLPACGGSSAAPAPATVQAEVKVAEAPPATATPAPSPTPKPSPTPEPSPTPSPAPTVEPSPTPAPTAAAVSNDSCIGCHTDQEQLTATAKEEVVVEKLSEGEG